MTARVRFKAPPTDVEREERRAAKILKSEVANAIAEESRMAEVEDLMQRAEHRELCFSVVLKGVDSSVDENTLRLACGKFGPVVAVSMAKIGSVPKVPTGSIAVGTASSIVKSLRCAIVDFKNEADADASVAALNGTALFGAVVEARRAYGEHSTREAVSEHLAKFYSGETKEVQAYGRRGGAFADRKNSSPPVGPPEMSPEHAEVALAAEDIVRQMEAAHSLGRPLHKLEYSDPTLKNNPTTLHDDIHSRLEVVKRAISDADEDFAKGHYELLNAANQEVAARSKFRLPAPAMDDPADVMIPTTVETLTSRKKALPPHRVALPVPPEAIKPRPPSLLDALRKRHIRMGRQTKEIWSNPETLDGGSIFKNIDRDIAHELDTHNIEAQRRLIPPEPEPEVSSLSDTVMALIRHYEPTPGESDGEESVESIPDDVELSKEVVQVVLELYTLKRRLAEERAALKARQRSLEDARKSVADYKAAVEADKDAAAKARDEMARLAGEVNRLEGELGHVMQCESDRAAADLTVEHAEKALADSTRRQAELRAQQDEARAEEVRLAVVKQEAEANAEAAKRRHDELTAALATVEDEERQVVDAQKEQQRLAEAAASASASVAATQNRLAELREQETDSRAEEERLTHEIENAEAIAEAGRLKAEQLKKDLEQAEKEIAERREEVKSELESLQPVVDAASKAVKSIKTSQLDEMKAMLKPPEGVRLTMESVMILLGKGKMDWSEIRKEVVQKGFIESVLELDASKVKKKSTDLLRKTYLSNEAFKPEKIARASKAASPLCTWATAQVSYAEALRLCRPLTEEVERLRLALEEQHKAYKAAMAEIEVGSPETIAKMKTEREAIEKRLVELEAALPAIEAMLEKQAGELAAVTEQHGAAAAKLSELREHAEVLANIDKLKQDLDSVQLGAPDEIAKMQSNLDCARAAIVEMDKDVVAADKKVATQTSELDMASAKQKEITAKLVALRPKAEVQEDLERVQMSLLQLVWDQMDGNQDSVLDHSELLAVLLLLEGEEKVKSLDIAKVFAEVDTNGNNEIDFDEFSSWFLRDYREKLLQLGAEGLLMPKTDTDETLTQLEALTKAVKRLETEISEVTAAIAKLEDKELAARELLASLQPEVPDLGQHAHQAIKLITPLPEWCREQEDAVLNWFGLLLPSVERPRYRAVYASDPVPEVPESSDEEVEILEGWVPVSSLTVAGIQVTRDTCETGMDIEVVPYDELREKWRSCGVLSAWSREGAAFAGKPGYVMNLPYEWDETVYIRCPDFGMTAAMQGLPETDEEEEEGENEEDEEDEEDEENDVDNVDGNTDGDEPQWSTAEHEEFELRYAQENAVVVAGKEALDRVAQIDKRNQQHQQASQWAKQGRDLEAQSDYAGALAAWEKVSELVPEDKRYKNSRARAEKRCRVPLLLEEAHALLTGGKYMEAARALGKAQDLDPKNEKIQAAQEQAERYWTAATLKKSGHRQMERGDYTAAKKSFAKAMSLNTLDEELASLHEEASAVASHVHQVSSSYAMILVKAWFKALQAEVTEGRKQADQAKTAALLQRQKEHAAEMERLAAEERAKAETCTAATKIQSLFRGFLGRRQAAWARARAARAAAKAAQAAEKRAKKAEELRQKKLQNMKNRKGQGQESIDSQSKRRAVEEESHRTAIQQFDGAFGLLVEGVPVLEYNTVYLPDGKLDNWPRWSSAEGKVLFRCVTDGEWHLSDKGSAAPVAYCETDGEIPVGTGWMCWSSGAWNSFTLSILALYTQDEVVEQTQRFQRMHQEQREKLRQEKAAARAMAQEENERAEAAIRAEAAARVQKKRTKEQIIAAQHEHARVEAAAQAEEQREKLRQEEAAARAMAQEEKEQAEAALRAEAAMRAEAAKRAKKVRTQEALAAQHEKAHAEGDPHPENQRQKLRQEAAAAGPQSWADASKDPKRAEQLVEAAAAKQAADKRRAKRLAEALAAKEAAAAEAFRTQVVPSWVVDKMLKVAEPGDHVDQDQQEPTEGTTLPLIADDALQEIHNDFLVEKEAMKRKLESMGLGDLAPQVEEDENVDVGPSLSQSIGLADTQGGADEVDEEDSLVPVPPSPELRPRQQRDDAVPDTEEIVEELFADGPKGST